jgi:TonB-dependent SusC/RagA subfamily outer membrane receptor
MPRSSPQAPHRTTPGLTLLAALLLATAPACARRAAPSPPEPQAAAPEDTITAADLTSAEIEKRPQEPVASLLQSRAAGVEVAVNSDGSISLRIRGASSFYAGTEPLIVVDGTPLTPGSGGTLRGINPHDIESIRVLKNPGDTGLYGVRGANGVIVVTTKRPMR